MYLKIFHSRILEVIRGLLLSENNIFKGGIVNTTLEEIKGQKLY